MVVKGVQFLTDVEGKKTAVVIDLKRHRELWEDLYDTMIAEGRKTEPRVTWESTKRRLQSRLLKRA